MTRKVLITAGGSGIGKAMAEGFEAEGYDVWITDLDQAALDECPTAWQKSEIDAADPKGVAALFTDITNHWGSLDVLCANAGIAGPTALIEDIDPDDFKKCISVNLEGAFLATKHAAPMMKQQRSGAIVLVSSMAGVNGFPGRAPYASAKWAINGLMKTLAMELGPFGIRANSICPGCVDGPRMQGVMEREAKAKNTTPAKIREGYEAGVSMRSFIEAVDVANLAIFLSSEKARFVTGQIIGVDGHTENPDPKV